MQGYFQNKDWHGAVRVPLCQIPCGSSNALAANCGLSGVADAVHALCKGQVSSLDVASIVQPPARYFFFLSIAFGFVSNLDVGTEWLRYTGEGG